MVKQTQGGSHFRAEVGPLYTPISTKLLLNLGWHCPDADEEFSEHVGLRTLNSRTLRDRLPVDAARQLLGELPEPWILKDPRLLHTLDEWLPLFEESGCEPVLLWLTRDLEQVAASYRRRGEGGSGPEVVTRGLTLSEANREAARIYCDWPFGKLQLSYEQIRQAISLFDIGRG